MNLSLRACAMLHSPRPQSQRVPRAPPCRVWSTLPASNAPPTPNLTARLATTMAGSGSGSRDSKVDDDADIQRFTNPMSGGGGDSPSATQRTLREHNASSGDEAAERQLSAAVDPVKLRKVFDEIDTDGGGARAAQQKQAAAQRCSLSPRRHAM